MKGLETVFVAFFLVCAAVGTIISSVAVLIVVGEVVGLWNLL